MRQDDYTFATYRGHAHTLARGVPMEGVLAELLGRANGLLGGKGGSMHLTSVEHGMMGSYAIIGAHLTIATGAAWSAQYRGRARSPSASSATARPTSAPSTRRSTTPPCASSRSSSCARTTTTWSTPRSATSPPSPARPPTALRRTASSRSSSTATTPTRSTSWPPTPSSTPGRAPGPSLVEALTYRHGGHSRADPGKYSRRASWRRGSPTTRSRSTAAARTPRCRCRRLDGIDAEVAQAVDEATEAAGLPPARPQAAFTDVWADGGRTWRI